MFKFMRMFFVCVLCSGMVAGCQSISANKITEANGEVTVTPVAGLPIVVQVPSKAVFIVTVKRYKLVQTGGVDNLGNPTPDIVVGHQEDSEISPQPIFLGRPEVYTVDLKRPAFGTIDYAVDLANYYPTKITGKLDDKTLGELLKFASDTLSKLSPVPGVTKQSGELIQRVLEGTSVKLLVFDLVTGTMQIVTPETVQ